ncbi:MAG: hypothetical protein UH077_07135 [Bacteroidales bacterium]|nr:hypothetical protein [Bacteroidales bacterium]
MYNISKTSIELIEVIRNNEPKNVISAKWNDLAECINDYKDYTDIPNVKEVSEAMFLYLQSYTNKVYDEECIRSFITFCLLKRATEETTGKDRIESFIRLTLILSKKLKYLMPVMHYTMPKQMSNYSPGQIQQLSPEQVELIQRNYNAIKVYIYNNVVNEVDNYPIDKDLIERYQVNTSSFIKNQTNESYNLLELSDGKELLDTCYQRILEYGKYPLYVIKEETNTFFKKSRGLIKSDFMFQANTCMLTDRGLQYDKAPTEATFIVRMKEDDVTMMEDKIEISTTGIKEEFIRPFLSQSLIFNTVIRKLDQRMEMQLSHQNIERGDRDNVPAFLEIQVENGKIVELQFQFFVGEKGWPRFINLYGESVWIKDDEDNKALMSDFNFILDNVIDFNIKEKYLPVRAMTAENMGILGDVAIVGCNPIKYHNLGNFTMSDFEIVENDNTEYFVFSKYSPLYNDLVHRVQSMNSWIPEVYAYYTIKGWVHGALRVVHIDNSLYQI